MQELKFEDAGEGASTTTTGIQDVLHPNERKEEFPPSSEPNSYDRLMEDAIVKYEDDTQQSDFLIKSEALDTKFGILGGDDDIYIKTEPLVIEELHIKSEHDQTGTEQMIKTFTCEEEGNVETGMTDVGDVKTHTQEKAFKCNVCSYRCAMKGTLKTHVKIHTGEKPFKCIECEYKCTRNSTLKRHAQIHIGEKPFKCNLCDYRCLQNGNLKEHVKTHTGEKPFKCIECDYKCNHKSNLKVHAKIHTGEKPFQCDVCGYRCTFKQNLTVHAKTHIGQKPYNCNVCDYRCTRKDSLIRHVKTHTKEKP